jgi:hypothetical protein
MEPSNPTRPVPKLVHRQAPEDPNRNVPRVSNEDLGGLIAAMSAKVAVVSTAVEGQDVTLGECLKATVHAGKEATRACSIATGAQAEAAAARGEAAGARSEAAQAKGIAARVLVAVERLEATVGSPPKPEEVVRAMQRQSQRDLTPAQVVELEAELRRASEGTGLWGMIVRGAQTDASHAQQLREMAKEVASEAAKEAAAGAVVEGARAGAIVARKEARKDLVGQASGIVAVAGTGTFATIVAVLYFLGPEGGARVAGAVRAIFTTLFGG